MKEELLHFIWKYRLYDSTDLRTTTGEPIEIVQTGMYNTDAGADFSNARIRIGEVLLAGNVEMHIAQSDWYAHHHDHDAAYNNVILHVVYETDSKPTLLQNGQTLAVLCLKDHIAAELLERYDMLRESKTTIACESLIKNLPDSFPLESYFDRLVIERLQTKVAVIEAMLTESKNDWDQVAFQMIAMYFGASVNKEPFALLARSLPMSVIHKHRADPVQIEALLYGQAGMLDAEYDDDYPKVLKREYTYLRKLHSLTHIEPHSWKFFRIRPVNFPTIKIAQLAAFLIKQPHLFDGILSCETIQDMRAFFDADANAYWHTHFQFDKPVAKANADIGHMLTDVLLINAVVPLLFTFGRYKDDEAICQRALDMLGLIPSEDNAIVRMWGELNVKVKTANDSQAVIQLYNSYCQNKRCLQCQIGHKLLQ